MKRPVTLLKVLTAVVAVIALFTACKQFLDDPEDFFGYWASETFVKSHNISSAHRSDGAGVQCVGCSAAADIMLSVHNPKGFSLVMPSSSAPAGIVEFKELSELPTAGMDYDLIRTGSGTLKLTYKEAFLEKYEQGSGNLNPTITLKTTDGRVFKKTYTFDIKSNTPPPKPAVVLAKTKTSPSKYVLCLQFDSAEMTKTVTIGSDTVPVHKDVRKITINDSPYTLLYKGDNSGFQKPAGTFSIGSFIESGDVQKLDSSFPNVPSGAWVLYFNTGVAVQSENQQTSYTITLSDAGGVVSDSVTAGLKEKFEVKFNAQGGKPDPDTQYIENNGMLTRPPDPAKLGHIFGGWYKDAACSNGQKWDFDANTVTGNMTLYAQWTEMNYTVTYRVEIVDGEAGGTIEVGSGSPTTSSTVSVMHGDSITFTADPTNTDWEVAEWSSNVTPSSDKKQATLSNVMSNDITVTVKFYQSTLKNPATWKDLARAVKSAPDNATLTIDGEIKATDAEGNNGVINTYKILTIKGNNPSAALNANGKSGILDAHNTLTLENITLKNGKWLGSHSGGAGVYVNSGGTLIMQGSSTIEDCSAANSGGGVYVSGGTFEMHGSSKITRCSADKEGGGVYVSGGTFKMHGSSAITGCEAIGNTGTQEYGEGGGVYNKGSFEMTGGEIKNNKARVGGGIYNGHKLILTGATLTGNTATFIGGALCISSDSSSEMTGGKIISNTCSGSGDGGGVYIHAGTFTLKSGASGASIESNTADYGGGAYVGQHGTLIINGGSIKLNKARKGGGVYVSGNSTKRGTLRMIKGDISDNGAGWNGTSYTGEGGGVYNKGTVEMTGGEIKDNKAETGGGVYFSEGTFEMKGSAVVTPATGSEANSKGKNDVYLVTGQTITVDGTLSHAHAARITPQSYTATTVLQAGSGVTLTYEVGKFTVTSKVIEDGIAEIWKIKSTGDLEKSKYIDVRYDKLAYYLSSSYASSYAVEGINYIKITGTIPKDDLTDNIYPSSGGRLAKTIQYAHKKVALKLPDSIPELTTMYNCFTKCEYLVSLEKIPSGVTSMKECFRGCTALTKAPVIPDSVNDMEHCFDGCTALTQAPTIHPGVTNMKWCFQDCKALTSAPVIPQGITDIYSCFQGCENLTQVPNIPSSVTGMGQCFKYCAALTDGPDIPSNVENMWQCFEGCTNLRGLKLMCNYNDQGTYFTDVFNGCSKLNNGGIKVPQKQLRAYQDGAGHMGTTADKFSAYN